MARIEANSLRFERLLAGSGRMKRKPEGQLERVQAPVWHQQQHVGGMKYTLELDFADTCHSGSRFGVGVVLLPPGYS